MVAFVWVIRELVITAMFRYLLTAYFLLLTASGANPCCCAYSRMVGMVRTASGDSHCQDAATPTCCGGLGTRTRRIHQTLDPVISAHVEQHAPKHTCACALKVCKSLPPERSAIVDHSRSCLDHAGVEWAVSRVLLITDVHQSAFLAAPVLPPSRMGRDTRIALCSWRC